MIKHTIKDILRSMFTAEDELLEEAATRICGSIEDDLMQGIKTAVQVRIHGIPQ